VEFPQERNVEHIVNVHLWRKLKHVRHDANAFKHSVRTEVLWSKLGLATVAHCGCRPLVEVETNSIADGKL
jgi:hypothetical protein